MAGKGSKQRALGVPKTTFDENWDLIFGKKNSKVPAGPLHRVDLDATSALHAENYIKTAVHKYNQQSS
jgi:hypothetical protein